MLTGVSARSVFIEGYIDPYESMCLRRLLAGEEVGSTTVTGHTRHGERIEFLMASVYSHGQRQEVRDACASTRCSRINVSTQDQNAMTHSRSSVS